MKNLLFSACFVSLFVVASCRVPTSPSQTADVIGSVALDSSQLPIIPYGVQVVLEGTDFSAVTDSTGHFEIKNVPSGNYTMKWSMPGYGDVRDIGVDIQGGGNTPVYITCNGNPTPLRHISPLVTTLQTAFFTDSVYAGSSIVLKGTYTDPQYFANYRDAIVIYFSHHSDVSPIDNHYDDFYYAPAATFTDGYGGMDTITHTFQLGYSSIELSFMSFQSGDSIYIATYGAPSDAMTMGGV
ncbi:MAG TPA: carboxypeptidase-like regulatory domain-containing protein, partial [Candidatus Kapabacteria bacterium]